MSTLQEYRAFVAVVEKQSVTQAAEILHRSASAISKQLAKLEQDLEVQLIDRTTQSVVVTPLGREFYEHCRRILGSVEEAERAIKDQQGGLSGRLSISIPEGALRCDLIEHLTEFTSRYPDVKFDISVSNQVEDLLKNRHDFAFRIGDVTDSRLSAIPLMQANLILVAAPSFIASRDIPKTLPALARANMLLVPSYVNMQKTLRQAGPDMRDAMPEMEKCHRADSELAIVKMAIAGLGVAGLLDITVQRYLEDGSLVQVMPERIPFVKTIHLVHRAQIHATRLHTVFKSYMMEQFPAIERSVA